MAGTEVSGQPVGPILKGHATSFSWTAWPLKVGTDRLSRNAGN